MFSSLKLTNSNATANQEIGHSISPTHITTLNWNGLWSEALALIFLVIESLSFNTEFSQTRRQGSCRR